MGKILKIIFMLPSIALIFLIDSFFIDGLEMEPQISETYLLPLLSIIMGAVLIVTISLKRKKKLLINITLAILIILNILLGTLWGFDIYYEFDLTVFLIYLMCVPVIFIHGLSFAFSTKKREIGIFGLVYGLVYLSNLFLLTIYGEIGVFFLIFFFPGFIGYVIVLILNIKQMKKEQSIKLMDKVEPFNLKKKEETVEQTKKEDFAIQKNEEVTGKQTNEENEN